MREFFARSASDLGVPAQLEGLLARVASSRGDRGARPAARRVHRPRLRRSAARGAHGARPRGRRLRARGQARRAPAARADAVLLLRPAGRDRPQRQLGRARIPRAAVGAAVARAGSEDDRSRAAARRVCDADGGRLRGRLRRGRRGDRRRARRGRALGRRARDGPVPQRVRLQTARAPGLPRAVSRRRADELRGRLDVDSRRLDARRRHGRQLHELHPHAAADPRGVGGDGHRGHRSARLRAAHRQHLGAAVGQRAGDRPERARTRN